MVEGVRGREADTLDLLSSCDAMLNFFSSRGFPIDAGLFWAYLVDQLYFNPPCLAETGMLACVLRVFVLSAVVDLLIGDFY